jgi:type IV secretory pathway VirD2 relaxase
MRAHFRKGSAGKARPIPPTQRRVVVKARYAMHGSGKGAPLRAHVSYLAREGKSAERTEPGLERSVDYLLCSETSGNDQFNFFGRSDVGVDGKAITAAWAADRLHFRLIISAEDGEALGDLKPFIREVMAGLEHKLGTKLEWVAVDHWDTDNPHTHVLVRGRRADGQDLFIPSKVISSGIRGHAQEIVTGCSVPGWRPTCSRSAGARSTGWV